MNETDHFILDFFIFVVVVLSCPITPPVFGKLVFIDISLAATI